MLVSLLRSSGGAHFAQIVNCPVHAIPWNENHEDICSFAELGDSYPTQIVKVLGYLGHALHCPNHNDQNHSEVSSHRGKEGEKGRDQQTGANHLFCSNYPC